MAAPTAASNKNALIVGASIARPSTAAGELFAFKSCLSLLRQPDYVLRKCSAYYHCLNDRVIKNPAPVGASIARPLLAGVAIRIRIVRIVFATARPVTMEIVI